MASIRADARRHGTSTRPSGQLNLRHLAGLFACVVAIALMLIGTAQDGTSPWFVLLPTVVAVYAIRHLRS